MADCIWMPFGVVSGSVKGWVYWTIFPHKQYIVGNVCSLAFRSWGLREICKNVISCTNHSKQQCQAATYYSTLMSPWWWQCGLCDISVLGHG